MVNDDFINDFLGLTGKIEGVAAPQSPSATECISEFESRFPVGGNWSPFPHLCFNLYNKGEIKLLAKAARAMLDSSPAVTLFVVPDDFTEHVLEVPVTKLQHCLIEIVHMPCGFLIGPSTYKWVIDLRMIGSAYLSCLKPE